MNKLAAACIGVWVLAGAAASAQTDPAPARQLPAAGSARSDQAHLNSEIIRQLYGCWHPPTNASATASIRFSLNRDSTLASGPTLVKVTIGTQSQGVVESAMRAVRECRLHLPPAEYRFWREIEANFDAGPN